MMPVVPLYLVGDSNACIFGDRVLFRPDILATPLALRARWVAGLPFAAFVDGGNLHPAFADLLEWEHVTRYTFDPAEDEELVRASFLRADTVGHFQEDMSFGHSPSVVLFGGTRDLAEMLVDFGPNFDFAFDDPRYRAEAFAGSPELPLYPRRIVEDAIHKRFACVRDVVAALLERGVANVYVHSLHPPTVDDGTYYYIRRAPSLARVRYKMTLAINRVLRSYAEEAGAVFLDLWDDVTGADGVLDPRFRLDGDHLNLAAAQLTMDRLIMEIVRRRRYWRRG